MKKFLLVLLVPLVVSAAAVAAPNPASSAAYCANLQRLTPAMFAPTVGAAYKNLGACVSVKTAQEAQNTSNAAKLCTEERDGDAAAFLAAKGKSFADLYGTGNKKNAFGKCVSAKANAATATQQATELNAAKQCKLWRANATVFVAANSAADGKTFASYYGTNAKKTNAFGKCVSKLAKAQNS